MRTRAVLTGTPSEQAAPGLARNTLWALAAEVSQLVFGLVVLFAVARALGDAQYGRMASVLAIALVLSSLSQLGAQQLLMLDHASGHSFQRTWGRTLTLVLGGGVAMLLISLPLRPLLTPNLGWLPFALLFASQSLAFSATDYCVIAAQAHRRLRSAFVIRFGSGFVRAATAIVFLMRGDGLLTTWAWLALGSWVVVAVGAVGYVQSVFLQGAPLLGAGAADARRGLPYSANAGSAMFLDSSDRTMLTAYGFDGAAGRYAAGARMATLAVMPLMALVRASDFDFYARGRDGVGNARRFAIRLAGLATGYGVIAGAGVLLLAEVPEILLGERFAGTADVIRWLAAMPLLRGLQVFAANALTASGHQNHRTAAIAGVALLNFGANLYLIPRYDWRGAAASTLAAEALLVALLWLMLQRLASRTQDADERR